MNRWTSRLVLIALAVVAFPYTAPAPLIYRPGEGWTYEPYGSVGNWQRTRAKDQLEVAQQAFEKNDISLALKAARHTVNKWPLSDYAPQAQYLVGRCFEEQKKDEQAFNEYQRVLVKYPKIENYEEILKRQYEICNRYLGGQWFKIWGYVPAYPSMEKTAEMYQQLIKNGPYSEVAPQAQLNIGAAHEKQSRFLNNEEPFVQAVKAYEIAADRYHDKKQVAADALFKAGLAYQKQAKNAEYDQGTAAKAIAAFSDFMALFPNDPRVKEAQTLIEALRTEQARGALDIARFYEKRKHLNGALVYYNEVLIKDPNSAYAIEAKQRIESLKPLAPPPAGPK